MWYCNCFVRGAPCHTGSSPVVSHSLPAAVCIVWDLLLGVTVGPTLKGTSTKHGLLFAIIGQVLSSNLKLHSVATGCGRPRHTTIHCSIHQSQGGSAPRH
jgi:hypothetical protein